jgi:hypothetical protein
MMNRPLLSSILASILAVATASLALAQPSSKTPAESETSIAGKTIAIKYQAPSANGRTVFGGAGALLQNNAIWRAGAGNPTTLYTAAELNLGGLDVPPGAYTLFVQLDPKGWKLIVSKEKGVAANVYHKAQDLGRVPMTLTQPHASVETLKFSVNGTGGNTGNLKLEWANVAASVPFTVK